MCIHWFLATTGPGFSYIYLFIYLSTHHTHHTSAFPFLELNEFTEHVHLRLVLVSIHFILS